MGKSGGRRKKSNNLASSGETQKPVANGSVTIDSDSTIFLKRAHEIKEEGNKLFQAKDYAGALEQYENAIKLIPKSHPDRAVFHSNRAACLMQMRPIDYETVISECTLALQVQPRFGRALLRRARAYEATGRCEMAMQDVQSLLGSDPKHGDALEIARRLRMALGPRMEAQPDHQSRPSPAALGASAVRGAPIAGLGPCLPARPVSKKAGSVSVASGSNLTANSKAEKPQAGVSVENGPESKAQLPKIALKLSNGNSKPSDVKNDGSKGSLPLEATVKWRQLKLVYDHDIRLAQMPVNCSFKSLREIVRERFPASKSVLIKYKDTDGDLVTITCNGELRMAESSVDSLLPKSDSVGLLRLHIVEVAPEQEPPLIEEEEEKAAESEEGKGDESVSHSSLGDSGLESVDAEVEKTDIKAIKEVQKEKVAGSEETECKEMEMDDWLYDFAQLFRTHVGIDPDAHIDLHEIGMELCSEALEETVTSEEAQSLFDKAAMKFQEVAALAFFNWGNVHMCAARKRIPIDDSAPEEVKSERLKVAYDWVNERYTLAKEKYEEALQIKPDFYEGLLALGQQQFEMAKLQWSYTQAKKEDLSKWDSTATMKLFDNAEEKMKAATEMWEKLEEQRAKDLENPSLSKEEASKRKKKGGNGGEAESSNRVPTEPTPEELAEQAALMRSQIHLFWGNMLFERSQIEHKLGQGGWKENLDAAVERFKLAGASETDIAAVLNNHCSNATVSAEGDGKKADVTSVESSGETGIEIEAKGKH